MTRLTTIFCWKKLVNYLNNRKQYIQFDCGQKTIYKTVKCGVSQRSILGPLLFLLYIYNLQFASDLLDPIIFADDTKLFYSKKDMSNKKITKIWIFITRKSMNGLFLTSSHLKWKKKQILVFPQTLQKIQGRIQGSSSYANDEVIFPSSEI